MCAFGVCSPSNAAEQPPPQVVEVSGGEVASSDASETVMKRIVSASEIARFGDATLSDVFRRIPGVTVVTVPGRSTEVRLRGFGGGQTQILVNGEPTPAGFSVDSIAPSLIERIEVVRAATADRSTESIAGAINIVLKSSQSKSERTYQVGLIDQDGRPGGSASTNWIGKLSPSLKAQSSLSTTLERSVERVATETDESSVSDPLSSRSVSDLRGDVNSSTTNASASIQSKTDSRLWKVEASARDRRISSPERQLISEQSPIGDSVQHDVLGYDLSTVSLQLKGTTEWTLSDGAKLNATLSLGQHRRLANSELDESSGDGSSVVFERLQRSLVHTRTINSSAKYEFSNTDNHVLSVGWDGQQIFRSDSDAVAAQPDDGTEQGSGNYNSRVRKLATFVQDDWTISRVSSLYAGLRLESVSTYTSGNGASLSGQSQTAVSPTFQWLRHINGDADILRAALSQTFKMPDPRDLIPTRTLEVDNGPLNPDEEGNPSLRPERSWNLDTTYEKKLDSGSVSVTGFAKMISQVLLRRSAFDESTQRWVTSTGNFGNAVSYGVEIESSLEQKKLMPQGPDITWTLYASMSASKLDQRANGRGLDLGQPLLARVGWEHKLSGKWQWGGQFQYDSATASVNVTNFQTLQKAQRLSEDLYASYSPARGSTLKIAVVNASSEPYDQSLRYYDGASTANGTRSTRSSATGTLSWRSIF